MRIREAYIIDEIIISSNCNRLLNQTHSNPSPLGEHFWKANTTIFSSYCTISSICLIKAKSRLMWMLMHWICTFDKYSNFTLVNHSFTLQYVLSTFTPSKVLSKILLAVAFELLISVVTVLIILYLRYSVNFLKLFLLLTSGIQTLLSLQNTHTRYMHFSRSGFRLYPCYFPDYFPAFSPDAVFSSFFPVLFA